MYLSALPPPLPKLMGPTRESPQRAKPSHSPFTSLQLMWRNFSRFLEKFLTMFGWQPVFFNSKKMLHYRTRLTSPGRRKSSVWSILELLATGSKYKTKSNLFSSVQFWVAQSTGVCDAYKWAGHHCVCYTVCSTVCVPLCVFHCVSSTVCDA